MHKRSANGVLSPPHMLAARIVTWDIDKSDQCVISDSIAHLTLPLRSDEAAPFLPPALAGVVVEVLGVDLNSEGDWGLSYIPLSGVIDIPSSLQGDFLLIQEKGDKFSINRPSNTVDVFQLGAMRLKHSR